MSLRSWASPGAPKLPVSDLSLTTGTDYMFSSFVVQVFVHVESHEMVDSNKGDLEWSSQSSANGTSRKHSS